MQVLDLVVHGKLRQQELQPRHQALRERLRRQRAGAELRGDLLDHAGQFAEHVVARQPEARHVAEIGVRLPLLAGKARDQVAHVVRPAVAAGERQRCGVCWVRRFDAHGGLPNNRSRIFQRRHTRATGSGRQPARR